MVTVPASLSDCAFAAVTPESALSTPLTQPLQQRWTLLSLTLVSAASTDQPIATRMDASVRMFFIMVVDDVVPCWTGLGHSYSRRPREALLRYRKGFSALKGGAHGCIRKESSPNEVGSEASSRWLNVAMSPDGTAATSSFRPFRSN